MGITQKNHYVPQLYLKNFSDTNRFIHRFRFLVSAAKTRPWEKRHISDVAFHHNLYTSCGTGEDDDDLERWLGSEFEITAGAVLARAITDQQLTPADFRTLAKFVELQILRTPAHYFRKEESWYESVQKTLKESHDDLLSRAAKTGSVPQAKLDATFEARTVVSARMRKLLPIRVTREDDEELGIARFRTDAVTGRPMWRYEMQRMLKNPEVTLVNHRWTILHAPIGIEWPTSDDPVMCLNYQSANEYNFGGGWGSDGTEIMLPISPTHLLYTQINKKVPPRGTILLYDQALKIKHLIVEHAHREIYSLEPDDAV